MYYEKAYVGLFKVKNNASYVEKVLLALVKSTTMSSIEKEFF